MAKNTLANKLHLSRRFRQRPFRYKIQITARGLVTKRRDSSGNLNKIQCSNKLQRDLMVPIKVNLHKNRI